MSLNQTCKPWSGAALAATELAPDVQEHDKGDEEQAEHEHRRRPTAHAKARGSSVGGKFAQGSSLPPLRLQPPRRHHNRTSSGRPETRLASPAPGSRPTHPPRRRMPWRPPQQLRGSPPPQPPPPPGRGAHLQARRVVGVEAQNASTAAAARRPAARRRAPRGSRPLRHRAAACRARARASRPLGDGASSVSLRHAERSAERRRGRRTGWPGATLALMWVGGEPRRGGGVCWMVCAVWASVRRSP